MATLLVGAAVVVSLASIAGDGMVRGHDLLLEILRADQYRRALIDGQLPPRWAADLEGGYGYPIFNFFPPLPLAGLAALRSVLGSWTAACEAWVALCSVVAGLGMARWLREHVGPGAAAVAGAAFALAPYRVWNGFGRDAFSELFALSVAPLVMAELARVTDRERRPGAVATAALAGAVFALAHNLSVVMFGPLALAYALPRAFRNGRPALARLAAAGSGAIALSAFYTVPAILELRDVGMEWSARGRFGVVDNALSAERLVAAPWPGVLAWGVAGAVLAVTVSLLRAGPSGRPLRPSAFACSALRWIAVAAGAAALAFPVATPLWEAVPALYMFQFPWRVLGPASFAVAAALGFAAEGMAPRRLTALAATVLVGSAIACAMVADRRAPRVVFVDGATPRGEQEQGVQHVPSVSLEPAAVRQARFANTTVADEFLPRTVTRRPPPDAWVRGRLAADSPAAVEPLDTPSLVWAYRVDLGRPGALEWLAYDFPGWWEVTVDGNEITPSLTPHGTLTWPVGAGRHQIVVRLRQTPLERAANATSIAGLLGLLITVIAGARRRRDSVPTAPGP
ncbi:MAG: hypothetical protein H6741_35870 [Alphaproteobacteria bacterium]|nr:hypothetical protein [Myxococcales bacterium]MCB9520376.1 hypothetical protein [Myxococcales bacterium]MCB9798087.1 hypothetical protein [Alphaproteobacteria bacterium]